MQAVDILMNEHRLIERGLAILGVMATRINSGDDIPVHIVRELLEFFKTFADQCHHHKEEALLFPKLNDLGIPLQNGPIEAMIHEHEQGRELMLKMFNALNTWDDQNVRSQFDQAACGYIDLLRQHIEKEDQGIFQIAEGICSLEDDRDLTTSFEKYEMGDGLHDHFHSLIDKLETEFLNNQ